MLSPEHIFLLTEGTIQIPPNVQQPILEWISAVYAEHSLQTFFSKYNYNVKQTEDYKKQFQIFEDFDSYKILNELNTIDPHKHKQTWKKEFKFPWGPYDEEDDAYEFKNNWYKPVVKISKLNHDLYHIIFKYGKKNYNKEFKKLNSMFTYLQTVILAKAMQDFENFLAQEDKFLIEIENTILEISKYQNSKFSIKNPENTIFKQTFKINLDGWKYNDDINNQLKRSVYELPNHPNPKVRNSSPEEHTAKKLNWIKIINEKTITVSLHLNDFGSKGGEEEGLRNDEHYTGLYKGFLRNPNDTIEIVGMHMLSDFDDFIFYLNQIKDTVNHELVHLSQDIMSNTLGAPINSPAAGYPSRHINPDHNSDPIDIDDKEHPLRDIEFYPKLNDAVTDFSRALATVGRKWSTRDKYNFYHYYVGTPIDYLQAKKELDSYGIADYEFFWTLKEHDLPRWKKAVKEFYKILHQKGLI